MSNVGTPMRAALTAEQLRHLVTLDPSNSVDRGRLTALRRQTTQSRQLAIIDRMLATPAPTYGEPANRRWWRRPPGAPTAGEKPLTASDLAWLQRLPTDPAQMTEADVKALARMAAQVDDKTPVPGPDARLVASIYEPVVAHLERQARIEELKAEVGSRTAPPAPPAPPAGVLLMDTVVQELADLEESRAREQLAAARAAGQAVDGINVDRQAIAARITAELTAETTARATALQERRTAALSELQSLEAS